MRDSDIVAITQLLNLYGQCAATRHWDEHVTSKVVIAGGSGALGTRLVTDLAERCELVVLTRRPDAETAKAHVRQVPWDGETVEDWAGELDGPGTVLINLAGKLVDCRPTPSNISELIRSRIAPTRALVRASQPLRSPLAHWVQASTTAIWSDAGETRCSETTPLPADGLPQMTGVARPWEEAFDGANTDHGVILRTSIVLDPLSTALKRLFVLTRLGLGGRVAEGRQWVSWIHIDDWVAIVRACLRLDQAAVVPAGVLVASAPDPVRNAQLMAALRGELHRPGLPRIVAWRRAASHRSGLGSDRQARDVNCARQDRFSVQASHPGRRPVRSVVDHLKPQCDLSLIERCSRNRFGGAVGDLSRKAARYHRNRPPSPTPP